MPTNRNSQLQDEELPLDPELENAQDPVEEDVVEEEEAVEEEVEEDPVAVDDEERVPKSRLDAERARADAALQALEILRQNQQPQRQEPQRQAVDEEANLTPEDKKWREYIRQAAKPEIERRVREVLEEVKKQVDPLHRNNIEVQHRIAEQEVRRKYKDFDTVRDKVNETIANWYRQYGIVAPHEVAYNYVKGLQLSKTAPAQRVSNVRANAKQSATVPNKPPTKKVVPKGPISLNDVASMSLEDAERWLLNTGTKF